MLAIPSLLGSAFMPGASLSLGRSSASAPAPVVMAVASKKVSVGVIGTGLVGAELLEQLESCKEALHKQGLDITVASISKTKPNADGERRPWMLCDSEEGCSLESVSEAMSDPAAGEEGDFVKMADFLKESSEHAIIVDATASEAVSDFYPVWLGKGVHVVTPNKKAGSGDLKRWQQCKAAMAETGAQWGDETTVGAGLPILNTLRTDLLGTGDKVKTIEGIFSGTLSYLFNVFKPGMKFSDVVTDAKEKGFTEPDPRDDLSGTDVQRKVVILARELGLKLELDDVPVKSLVPDKLGNWQPPAGAPLADAFIDELKSFDAEMTALIAEADAAGEVLRYVGSINVKEGTASVKLGRFPKDHPFAGTQFADNIAAFNSKWYSPRPLVVQGPGAGASVTAAGVFGNVMESMKMLKR